ncbi:MAG: hypothetical protein ABI573_10055 [Chloroflexota bacterium]
MRIRLILLAVVLAVGASVIVVALTPRTSSVTGVVIAVDAVSLTDVRSFTLRVEGGKTLVFSLAVLESGVAFPPGHLAEHMGSAEPIVVTYRDDGGTLKALRISDVPVPSGG